MRALPPTDKPKAQDAIRRKKRELRNGQTFFRLRLRQAAGFLVPEIDVMTPAEKITKSSGSNLALAFFSLPAEKKRDISLFYAFCRLVDDIADEPGAPVADRQEALSIWRKALLAETPGEHSIAPELRGLMRRYSISPPLLNDLILGMEMDLCGTRYETLADLQLYCYRVAGSVGLVSIEIFGYQHPAARDHARLLGEALQLTNILRDVGDDYRNEKRIYLPLEMMRRHGYSEADLSVGTENENFRALMNEIAGLAVEKYHASDAAISPGDRRSLRAGLIMGDIYRRVLKKMQQNKFRVFSTHYRLSVMEKLLHVCRRTFFSF